MLSTSSFALLLMLPKATAEISIDYFDSLRVDADLSTSITNSSANNLFAVTDVEENVYRLAQITAFLPFSDGFVLRDGIENDAAAVILAVFHFNNREMSPFLDVEDLSQCNIMLTSEMFDTQFSPINSTRLFTGILQREHSLETPIPAGVVGAYRSAVTSPLAILTGVNNIPHISYASTSTDFDVKEQYPIFGRTVMSSTGEAQIAVDYFYTVLKATHVAVLFVTDAFGSALQKAFQDAASQYGITTDSVAFSYSADPNGVEIRNAVASLKNTQFNLFFVIAFEPHYEPIMKAAYEQNLIGDDKLWLFDGFDPSSFHKKLQYPQGSDLAKATAGIGLIGIGGGLRSEIIYPDRDNFPPVEEKPSSGFQRFRKAWRDAMANDEFVTFAKSKIPVYLNSTNGYDPNWEFSEEPTSYGPLIYDSVIGLGLSYCRALTDYNQTDEFTGPAAFEFFRHLDEEGASGRLVFDPETGTRDYTTLTFTILNMQPSEASDTEKVRFNIVPTDVYIGGNWSKIDDRQFAYAGGGTETPQSLPDPLVKKNYIGDTGRAIGYTLMAIVMAASIGCLVWLVWFRRERVVRSSQPFFLLMISLGALTMASSIIPLSLEETTTSESGLDTACMAAPWLYLSGAILAFSALLAKTRGVHQAYTHPELDFIQVTSFNILGVFSLLFGVNLFVLIPWTLVAPLEWHRLPRDSTDIFNRVVDSYGTCSNEDALPFVIVVLILNIAIVIIANWWAYQARNIETEYHESRYIGISMASILQAWCMGIPILIVVWDNPQAKFFVEAGIIFVTALAVLLLVFVPKMSSIRADHKKATEESKRQAYNSFQARSRRSGVDGQESEKVKLDQMESENGKLAKDVSNTNRYFADGAAQTENSIPSDDANVPTGVIATEDTQEVGPGEKSADGAMLEPSIGTDEQASEHQKRGRSSFLLGVAADLKKSMMFSKGSAEADSDCGIKIIHNPRTKEALKASGGREYSRAQLQHLEDLNRADIDDDDEDVVNDDGGYVENEVIDDGDGQRSDNISVEKARLEEP